MEPPVPIVEVVASREGSLIQEEDIAPTVAVERLVHEENIAPVAGMGASVMILFHLLLLLLWLSHRN